MLETFGSKVPQRVEDRVRTGSNNTEEPFDPDLEFEEGKL